MTDRRVTHHTFSIERTYPATPQRVFAAFADPAAKAKWFASDSADWTQERYALDFRAGGSESNVARARDGVAHRFEARYHDIVADQRIVLAYEMYLDDLRISVSLQTLELHPAGRGTRLVLTEQGAFLDGHDQPAGREQGTAAVLDALGAALE